MKLMRSGIFMIAALSVQLCGILASPAIAQSSADVFECRLQTCIDGNTNCISSRFTTDFSGDQAPVLKLYSNTIWNHEKSAGLDVTISKLQVAQNYGNIEIIITKAGNGPQFNPDFWMQGLLLFSPADFEKGGFSKDHRFAFSVQGKSAFGNLMCYAR